MAKMKVTYDVSVDPNSKEEWDDFLAELKKAKITVAKFKDLDNVTEVTFEGEKKDLAKWVSENLWDNASEYWEQFPELFDYPMEKIVDEVANALNNVGHFKFTARNGLIVAKGDKYTLNIAVQYDK